MPCDQTPDLCIICGEPAVTAVKAGSLDAEGNLVQDGAHDVVGLCQAHLDQVVRDDLLDAPVSVN